MISANSRLALAIRRTNAEYAKLDRTTQETIELDSIIALEAKVDTAMAAGDDPAAFAAVEAWEHECLRIFEEATRG